MQCRYFTHVVHLVQPIQSLWAFAEGLMERSEDLSVSSQMQRDELRRPKVR